MGGVDSPDALRDAVERLGSFAAVAREAGIPKSTVQSRADAWGVKSPHPRAKAERRNASVTPVGPPGTRTLDIKCAIGVGVDDLLKKHGIDPDLFDVVNLHVQHAEAVGKGGEPLELQRVRVTLREKHTPAPAPFDLPTPKPAGWTPKSLARARKGRTTPRLIVVSGDPHAPLHEPVLCEHLAAYVDEHSDRVSQLGFLGDATDNSPFGRHRPTPAFDHSVTDTWQAGYDHLLNIRSRAPHARAWFTIGNHDHWPMQRARELGKGLADATIPGHKYPILDPRTYLRLDELGIDCPGHPGAEYHASEIEVLPGLTAMHGTKTGAIGGAVRELSGWEGTAIIQGHDHKLGMFLTVRKMQGGKYAEHWSISAGTLARKDLGYDPRKNCAQGWLVIVAHPNGAWSPMFARYDHDKQITTCGDWTIG